MLVDIPDDLVGISVDALRFYAERQTVRTTHSGLLALADGIERRHADIQAGRPREITAETLTEDDVGRLMVLVSAVHDHDIRTRCVLWLDYTNFRSAIGPGIAAEINRRAKAVPRG